MGKLRFREVESPAPGHKAGKWQNQDLNPGPVGSPSGSFAVYRRKKNNVKTIVSICCILSVRNFTETISCILPTAQGVGVTLLYLTDEKLDSDH